MTNFPYNEGIPSTNNDPSVDQPDLLQNFSSLGGPAPAAGGILAVNHVSFNADNGGQHTIVQFNQDASYVPAIPVTVPSLFTQTMGGKTALKYWIGNQANTSDQYVISGNNGSTMAFGGIIIKWFRKVLTGTTTNVIFVAEGINAFPNGAFVAVADGNSSAVLTANLTVNAVDLIGIAGNTAHVIVIGN